MDVDRFDDHRRAFFDRAWQRLPFEMEYPGVDGDLPRPAALDEMLEIAERLSEGFPFVRVDLYAVGSHVYFGELTFTPEACNGRFRPVEWDRNLGDLIALPDVDPGTAVRRSGAR